MRLKKCPMCRMMVPEKIGSCPVCGTEYSKFQYFRINHLSKCILIFLALLILYNCIVIIVHNRRIRSYVDNPPENIAVVEELKKDYEKLNFIQKYFVRYSEIEIIENSVEDDSEIINVENYTCSILFTSGSRQGVYTGEMRDNLPDGNGTFVYYLDDGTLCTYDGEFEGGEITGFGVMAFGDGRKYVGEFKSGLIDGYGVVYNAQGYVVKKGEFLSNKLNGLATIYDDYGVEIYSGRFIFDVPSEREYKDSCEEATFAQIEANTEMYVNKNLKINGVVTEIAIQEDMTVMYVINIAGNKHKNICINYIGKNGVNIRQGDNLSFYGYCVGYRTFMSNSGEQHGGMIIKTYYAE